MDGDNDANEDPDGGDNAQDWHVKNNTALFQPWGRTNEIQVHICWWNWKEEEKWKLQLHILTRL